MSTEELSKAEDELSQFLSEGTRQDVRLVAIKYLAGVATSEEAIPLFLKSNNHLIHNLLALGKSENTSSMEGKLIFATLINATSLGEVREAFVRDEVAVNTVVHMLNPSVRFADSVVKLMSNLTVLPELCEEICGKIDVGKFVKDTVDSLVVEGEEEERDVFHVYMGYILRNMSQLKSVRVQLLTKRTDSADSELPPVMKLLSLIKLGESDVKRKLVAIDIVRNCCFDTEYHDTLTESDALMVALLYPLMGPEELKDDENEELSMDLQYMEAEKTRESNPTVRKRLLETLYQICATSKGREYLRDKGAYYVMREYHRWEKDVECEKLIGGVIGVLIRTEGDMGYDDLKKDIPLEELNAVQLSADEKNYTPLVNDSGKIQKF